MIPSHTLSNNQTSNVVINRLSKSNDYNFSEPHRHDYYELFYFQKGGGEHEIDFKPFEIKSDSFQLVAPGQVHQMKRSPGSMGFVLLFTNEDIIESKSVFDFLLEHSAHSVDERNPFCNLNPDESKLIGRIILDAWENKSKTSSEIMKHTLIGLCLRMKEQMPQSDSAASSDYTKFRQLIVNNFRKKRTVSAYANELNLTSKSLNELTKKHSGRTASDHIYKQVILEAKRLLLLGIPVKEVAFNLEFDDPAHFSKFFKKQVGLAPADFRKVHT